MGDNEYKLKMLSEEESSRIKEEIIKQIQTWKASEEQKQEAVNQIQEMPAEKLEEFLSKQMKKQECVFCLIVQGKISSYKILENEKAIAVLELNPLSSGHALIIPKKHEDEPDTALAEKTIEKLKKLSPKEIRQEKAQMGHKIISLIPDYGEKLERKQASKEELEKLQKILTAEEKPKPAIAKEKKPEKLEKAPRRMP